MIVIIDHNAIPGTKLANLVSVLECSHSFLEFFKSRVGHVAAPFIDVAPETTVLG